MSSVLLLTYTLFSASAVIVAGAIAGGYAGGVLTGLGIAGVVTAALTAAARIIAIRKFTEAVTRHTWLAVAVHAYRIFGRRRVVWREKTNGATHKE